MKFRTTAPVQSSQEIFISQVRDYIRNNSDESDVETQCKAFVQLVIDLYGAENGMLSLANMMANKRTPNCEERANPYHDGLGRFCSPEEAVFISPWANNRVDDPQEPPLSLLTEEQKNYYKKALSCSDEVMAYIRNKQEAEIYVK